MHTEDPPASRAAHDPDPAEVTPVTAERAVAIGPVRFLAFLALSAVWLLVVIVGASGLIALSMLASGVSPEEMTALQAATALSPALVAVITAAQTLGLLGIAAALVLLVRGREALGPALGRAFAWERPSLALVGAAAVGGLTVGLFPGWLAQQLVEVAPWLDGGNNALIAELLNAGSLPGRVAMLAMVVLLAPVCEELIFRGFLWDALSRSLHPVAVWGITTFLFAAFHMDPLSVIALLFTGAFLGWLRLSGKSVWPAVVAHLGNNLLAAGAAVAPGVESDATVPFWLAAGAGAATVGVAVLGWWAARRGW